MVASPEFDSFKDKISRKDPIYPFTRIDPPQETPKVVEKPVQDPLQDPTQEPAKTPSTAPRNYVSEKHFAEYRLPVVRKIENLDYCRRVDRRLKSVSFRNCLTSELYKSGFRSTRGTPIYFSHYEPAKDEIPLGRILVMGGVHGDELTSVSSVFLWMEKLKRFHSGLFEWRAVPLVNPDGFFQKDPQRTNANGIDLNRNLPTANWNDLANSYWKRYAKSTARKYPGLIAASEPETKWLLSEIKEFQPDVIITVHAPYNLVDFDAQDRSEAPRQLGILKGKSLGTFPGSLGRYAGEERNIPVLTLELPHSSRMPAIADIEQIWEDLVAWLRDNVNPHRLAGRDLAHCAEDYLDTGCI